MNEQNMNKQGNTGYEIDLRQIWAVFAARWFLIIVLGAVCGLIAFAVCTFIVPTKYTAQSTILILNTNKEDGALTTSDLTLSATLSKDFISIATSNTVIDRVNEVENTAGSNISASIIPDTRIIKIKVQDEDPDKAIKIADSVAEVAAQRISEIMIIPDMVRSVDKATLSPGETTPNTMKITAIAFILGFLFFWLIFVIAFASNDKINVVEDINKYLGEPVLGTVPLYKARLGKE